MRIDSHTHIFNLHTVLSKEAVDIMARRIGDSGARAFVADAVRRLLEEQLDHPEHLVEKDLLARLLDYIADSADFKSWAQEQGDALPFEIRTLGPSLKALGVNAMRRALDKLSTLSDQGDEVKTGVFDVFDTLRISMQADILGVTDKLLEPLGPDDAIVALMMDITTEDEPERDRRNFRAQLAGTRDAAVQRPGRVLPFVAVNPRRADHFALMKQAIEEMGFVGVKLYPSLGYSVDTPDMRNVYHYCVEQNVPLLMHCTDGGFYRDQASKEYCDPKYWKPVLEELPDLRLCFAHCGGWAGFGAMDHVTPGSWTESIVALMHEYENVYADLSAHMNQMEGGTDEENWKKIFRALLDDEVTRPRILFGTDQWLTRLHISHEHYLHYFDTSVDAADLALISEENPRRFLGLPDDAGLGMLPNIERYVAFIRAQPSVGAAPAAWLAAVVGTTLKVTRSRAGWSPNNFADRLTGSFMRRYMGASHKKLPFADLAPLRLRQLTYWNKEHVSDAIFREDCRAVALALASACVGSKATYEGTYGPTDVVDHLAEALADGERTLADLGATVDALFRFSTETA